MECPICLAELNDTVVTMGCCKQNMHLNCMVRWMNQQQTCPMCRAQHQGITTTVENHVLVVTPINRNTEFFRNAFVGATAMSVLSISLAFGCSW